MLFVDKEPTDLPKLVIRTQTASEEFNYLRYVLDTVPFSLKHGYKFEIPSHPKFKQLVEMSPNFDGVNWDQLEKVFRTEIYDPNLYALGIKSLEAHRPQIESAFPTFLQFNQNWGFKTFPRYDISLTLYGRGGSINEDTGRIILMTRPDGSFKRSHPAHTPVHEMVEIGIKKCIVDKFGLTHSEKERLVDKICMIEFGSILPGYKEQEIGDRRIDHYIDQVSIKNLPEAINRFKQKTN